MDDIRDLKPVDCILVVDDVMIDFQIPTYLSLAIKLQRDAGYDLKDVEIGELVAETIERHLRYDFRPPSDSQLQFARIIASTLEITLPIEAQLSKAKAQKFISDHVRAFYARRRKRVGNRKIYLPERAYPS